MSFIRKKKMNGGKIHAYEITAIWNSEKKQSRSKSKYLGVVDENGAIIPKWTVPRKYESTSRPSQKYSTEKEHLIQDFGNGFFVREFIRKSSIYDPLLKFIQDNPQLIALMAYRLCQPGPMYHCALWLQGNVLSSLESTSRLSSQDISRLLVSLGDESVQRLFFERSLLRDGGGAKNVIIDATSLPNNIQSDWSTYGYSDGGVEMQFRFHCVVDQLSKRPIFYRYVPGNISDISTLKATVDELNALGVKQSFALVDSGYCSKENIQYFRKHVIDFLMRLPAGRRIYKDMISKHAKNLENIVHARRYGKRTLFIARHETTMYEEVVHVYMVLDAQKKAKDLEKLIAARCAQSNEKRDKKADQFEFKSAGIFMLISSKIIPEDDIMSAYYTRQTVEQLFGFSKSDLDILPIRCHSEATIRGYLFLQFLLLVVFVEIREKFSGHFTVAEALMMLAALKCKIYKDKIIIQELTKQQKKIFELGSVLVPPTPLGI